MGQSPRRERADAEQRRLLLHGQGNQFGGEHVDGGHLHLPLSRIEQLRRDLIFSLMLLVYWGSSVTKQGEIDVRDGLVHVLDGFLGVEGNLLQPGPEAAVLSTLKRG